MKPTARWRHAHQISVPYLAGSFLRSILIAGALGSTVLVSACSPGRVFEAVSVLEDLQAYDQPSRLKDSTPTPERSIVTLDITAETTPRAALYSPPQGAGAGIILVPGVTPQGIEDPRVIAFATTLARARFDVLIPDLTNMWSLRLDAADAETVAQWVTFMEQRAPERPVGVVGVSFGAGPATIGLFRPAARTADFALIIGGYYDIGSLVAYVTTGGYRETVKEDWSFAPPDPRAKWVFARSNALRIKSPQDRALIDAIAQTKLRDPKADISSLVARLGPEGTAVFALLNNTDPASTADLIAGLAPALREEIDRLDIAAHDLQAFEGDIIVVHDVNDRVIPSTEGIKLARAAGTEATLVASLDHANLREPSIGDAIAMLRLVYTFLGFRADTP